MTGENNRSIIESSTRMLDAAAKVGELVETQRITTESVRELAEAIAGLPTEKRTAVMGFFANLVAAPWTHLLLQMIKDLSK